MDQMGSTLTDSHVRDNGGEVIVTLPLQVSASSDANGVSGYSPDGAGVAGQSENSYGVVGFTNATSNGIAGVLGGGSQYGVVGFATADGIPDGAWGVKGSLTGLTQSELRSWAQRYRTRSGISLATRDVRQPPVTQVSFSQGPVATYNRI